MFSKTKREKINSSTTAGVSVKAAPSIISANLHIVGNLTTDGEVQVNGSVKGDVTMQALTVGEKASITGEIVAEDVEIHGVVSGTIRARKIKLARTAKVIGDIWHEVLSIESGAYIEGQLKRAKKGTVEKEDKHPIKIKAAPVAEQSAVNSQTTNKHTSATEMNRQGGMQPEVKRVASN